MNFIMGVYMIIKIIIIFIIKFNISNNILKNKYCHLAHNNIKTPLFNIIRHRIKIVSLLFNLHRGIIIISYKYKIKNLLNIF